jgi:hypothetical protein
MILATCSKSECQGLDLPKEEKAVLKASLKTDLLIMLLASWATIFAATRSSRYHQTMWDIANKKNKSSSILINLMDEGQQSRQVLLGSQANDIPGQLCSVILGISDEWGSSSGLLRHCICTNNR